MELLTRRLFNEIDLYSSDNNDLSDNNQSNKHLIQNAVNEITDNKIQSDFIRIMNDNHTFGIGVIKPSSILGQCLRETQTSKLGMLADNNRDYSFFGDNHHLLFFLFPLNDQSIDDIYLMHRDNKDTLLTEYLLGLPVEKFLKSITNETVVNVDLMNELLTHKSLI